MTDRHIMYNKETLILIFIGKSTKVKIFLAYFVEIYEELL